MRFPWEAVCSSAIGNAMFVNTFIDAKQLKALLIDMDGTLVDSLLVLYNVYLNFLSKYGIIGSKQEFTELNGPSLREIITLLSQRHFLQHLNLDSLVEEYQKLLRFYYENELRLFPNAREVIAMAKNLGLKVAVVSSAERSLVEKCLRKNQIYEAFDAIVTSEGLKKNKPAPDIYKRALFFLQLTSPEAIAIEDSNNGVEAALNAGIYTLWMTHQGEAWSRTDNPRCLLVRDWDSVRRLLESLYE
jgi:HAD superfamily hydrolase (TIGR01509 family)